MKHLKTFKNLTEYLTAQTKLDTPCVSLIKNQHKVSFDKQSIIVAKYNVVDTTTKTRVFGSYFNTSNIQNMSVDGETVSVSSTYQFTTPGEHTVELILKSSVTSFAYLFKDCTALVDVDFSKTNSSKITSLYYAFYGTGIVDVDLNNLDTSNVTSMERAFFNCASLTSLKIDKWDASKVTTMSCMFYKCLKLKDLKIFKKVRDLTNLYLTFYQCEALESLDLSSWDVSKVKDLRYTFACDGETYSKLTNLNLNGWNTSSVTSLLGTFAGLKSLQELNIKHFNTSNVTSMASLFDHLNLEKLDLGGWDVSKVTSMEGMFYECVNLKEINFSDWDTSSVTNMKMMLHYCSKLTTFNISHFNTGKVTTFANMFGNPIGTTLPPLGIDNWDMSSATYIGSMFAGLNYTNYDFISGWNISKVTNLEGLFQNNRQLTNIDFIKNWDTSGITNMFYLCPFCTSLTRIDLRGCNLSKVTTMQELAKGCTSLNEFYIDSPITSLTNTNNMFQNTKTNGNFYGANGVDYSIITNSLPSGWAVQTL